MMCILEHCSGIGARSRAYASFSTLVPKQGAGGRAHRVAVDLHSHAHQRTEEGARDPHSLVQGEAANPSMSYSILTCQQELTRASRASIRCFATMQRMKVAEVHPHSAAAAT